MIPPVGSSSTVARHPRAPLAGALAWLLSLAAPALSPAPAPPPGATPAVGGESGTVDPLVDRVKGAVVTIQSTKNIRRPAMEDPRSRLLSALSGLGSPLRN